MYGHIRGWDLGAEVELRAAPGDPEMDCVCLTITSGSNGGPKVPLADLIQTTPEEGGFVLRLCDVPTVREAAKRLLEGRGGE
jgi:hypothetical protein